MDFSILISNPLINAGVISWISAQVIKTILDAVKHRSFNRQRLAGAGGMPSSHSAVCCSVVLTSYFIYGFQSTVFDLAFIVALIVMYDAMGVRRAAGEQAKVLNKMVIDFKEMFQMLKEEFDALAHGEENPLEPEQKAQRLKEFLGHTPLEVLCGAILGIVIAVLMPAF